MGFKANTYAKCWGVEPGKGKFTKVRLAISRKNKATGEYEQEFSDYCMFIGQAHAKAALLKEGDRIKLGEVDVTNTYDKTTKRTYYNMKVFDFEMADGAGGNSGSYGRTQRRPDHSEPDPIETDDATDTPF